MTYSPDVIALNPDLAKAQKKSRAVTPSGKGHGHADDIQDVTPKHYTPEQCRCILANDAAWMQHMIDVWGTGTQAQRRARAALELVILEAGE